MSACKKCAAAFDSTPAEMQLYTKMQVPPPTWCPQCRHQRRLLWRNEMALYNSTCAKCQKGIISTFSPKSPYTVYCHDCWWAADSDGKDFRIPYQWGQPFFPQFQKLLQRIPHPSIFVSRSENCEYTNTVADCKKIYLSFAIRNSENIFYSRWVDDSRDCFECNYIAKCELCYRCYQSTDCYHCYFLQDSDNCRDSCLLFDCNGCAHCFGCVGLRNVENYLFNQPASAAEVTAAIQIYLGGDREALDGKFNALKRTQPHAYHRAKRSSDCTGNYFIDAKRCRASYQVNGSQDCWYSDYNNNSHDACDVSCFSFCELAYECLSIYKNYQSLGNAICWNSNFVSYSYCCFGSQNCFGCAGLKNARYCFFNTEYSPEEYAALVAKVTQEMRDHAEWGEFFPPEISPFHYNESIAQLHFPLTADSARAAGWPWTDEPRGTFGHETTATPAARLDDAVTTETFACTNCQKNYRITPAELKFHRTDGLIFSPLCPECRILAGERENTERHLYHRQCMCTTVNHDHSGQCATTFETAYSPDRLERVYCDECYQKEIY